MRQMSETLMRVPALRLAGQFPRDGAVLVCGPREYLPFEAARAAMPSAEVVTLPEDGERLDALLASRVDVVVLAPDAASLTFAADAVDAARAAGTLAARVAVAHRSDEWNPVPRAGSFERVVGHRDLLLRDAEIDEVLDLATSQDRALRRGSGGVPALVAETLVVQAGRPGPEPSVAQAWAARIADAVLADPALTLHIFSYRLPTSVVRGVSEHVLGTRVSSANLGQARRSPYVMSTQGQPASMPDELADALIHEMELRSPGRPAALRRALVDLAATRTGMTGVDGIRLLSHLGEWDHLDRLLSHTLHLVLHLGEEQRDELLANWPPDDPGRPFLATARAYLSSPPVAGTVGLLSTWNNIAWLLSAEAPAPGTLVEQVRSQLLGTVRPGRVWTQAEAGAVLVQTAEWLGQLGDQLESKGLAGRSDDAALVVTLLLAAGEAAARLGDFAVATECAQRGRRLVHAFGTEAESYGSLAASVLAHSAYLAGEAGAASMADSRLAEYESAVHRAGRPMASVLDLADIAQRYIALNRGTLRDASLDTFPDPEHDFAPEQAAVQALEVLQIHGPDQALAWTAAMLERALAAESPAWAWWGVQRVRAMLLVRVGQRGLAGAIVQEAFLPEPAVAILRGASAASQGRAAHARQLVAPLLAVETTPQAWRLGARGVQIEQFLADGRESDVDHVLDAENWPACLAAVTLFTDAARAAVLTRVAPAIVAGLPGLGVAGAREPGPRPIKLTPRQRDVLLGIAAGETLGAIAQRLYIGTETVRSAAKDLYRRLDVHDRDAAIAKAREHGLL